MILGAVYTKLKIALDYTCKKKLVHILKLNQHAASAMDIVIVP